MTQKTLNSHNFPDVYKHLGINLNELGCVMLDVILEDAALVDKIKEIITPDVEYKTTNASKFWINGLVIDSAHVTLLYGLLQKAYLLRDQIIEVLSGWSAPNLEVDKVDFFESPDEEEYYTIIAKVKKSPELLEGHSRLEFLPHINTFPTYEPHITLAYIKKDEAIRDRVIEELQTLFANTHFKVQHIGLGKRD